ncbi:LPS translocon maturation chaperone LptM [Parvularcula sp. LCG005]|nr:lipoprotein [Parvularcula sp. LCG005]WOI53096.1 lipoprotein [Parvularcula sp. LCG005]
MKAALILFVALAACLSGCGRKAPLDMPPPPVDARAAG